MNKEGYNTKEEWKIKSKGSLSISIVIAKFTITEKLFQFIYGSRPMSKGEIMMTMLNIEINNNDDVRIILIMSISSKWGEERIKIE